MLKEKKTPQEPADAGKELSLDDCAKVTGGSIRDVVYTPTTEITQEIKDRI